MSSAEAGEFSLIVTEVESARLAEAARDFALAFSLDDTIAQQICKSAPIIFAQKLTKSEVKAISPTLTELSRSGIEFRVTARMGQKLPKVNWPIRPQFTAGGSGSPNGLAFEWENTAFVCPGCGETYLFRRLGKLKLADTAASTSTGPITGEFRGPVAPAAASKSSAPVPVEVTDIMLEPEPLPAQVEGVEGLQPLAGEGESLELPETMAPVMLEADVAEPVPVEPLPDLETDVAPAAPAAAPLPAEEMAADEAPPPGGDAYNVFLSKITDTSKREKAADLISKIKKCGLNEAKELTSRLVIPLAKNVGKERAEDILNQFKKLKIFGRMTKVK